MLISGAASTVLAEQFIVTLEHPLSANDRALRASLRLVEIDTFQHGQNSVVVFEAEGLDILEAYFFAKRLKPLAIMSFPTAWSDSGIEALAIEARMKILNSISCDFCTN